MANQQAFAIEIDDRPAGIVVGSQGAFVFFAADRTFSDLDRNTYRHVAEAERAARRVLAARTRRGAA